MPCLTPYRGDTSQMLLFKIASCLEASGAAGAAVLSFNGRTGDVILTLADVAAVVDDIYVNESGDTMTGNLVHPDGTAALPSITFTGDLDTGIYHPAANTIGLTAGGALIFAVSPTGVNLTTALAYQYNSVNVIRAQTALVNYYFGPSGNLTATGVNNVALGNLTLFLLTSGSNNVGVGNEVLVFNTTGNNNTGIGLQSLNANTTGSNNMAVGMQSLFSNTTGDNNATIGFQALLSNTSGSDNTAIGRDSLMLNTTGIQNTAAGRNSLFDVTTGSNNSAIGYNTGRGITTGSNNTILGGSVTGLAAALSNNIILADGAGVIRIQVDSAGVVTIPIALSLSTAAPLSMVSGANQRAGDAVLVGGTVTVANTTVTANTRVFLTRRVTGGTIGFAVTYTVIAATSFTITSDNVLDTSTYSYLLIEVP